MQFKSSGPLTTKSRSEEEKEEKGKTKKANLAGFIEQRKSLTLSLAANKESVGGRMRRFVLNDCKAAVRAAGILHGRARTCKKCLSRQPYQAIVGSSHGVACARENLDSLLWGRHMCCDTKGGL